MMVAELKEAVSKAEKLDANAQKEIAKLMSDEIVWDETFANTQEQLVRLAQQAIEEHVSGKTIKEDW